MKQIVANPETCQEIVDQGITPTAFLWHVRSVDVKKVTSGNPDGYYYEVFEIEEPNYIKGVVIPAWTMEELNVMIGGDFAKPDLMPMDKTPVLNDKKEKQPYFDYKFGIFQLSGAKTWPRGSQASALILSDLLKRSELKPKIVNQRYSYFFKH